MKTATLLLLLSVTALAEQLDGFGVQFGRAIKLVPLVEVRLRPHKVKHGPNEGLGFVGVAVSRLPSPWYRITLTIRTWDKRTPTSPPGRTNTAVVVLDNPPPGKPVRFRAVAWYGKPGTLQNVNGPEQYHTVEVAFEKYVPKGGLFQ